MERAKIRPWLRTCLGSLMLSSVLVCGAARAGGDPEVDFQPGAALGKGFELLDDTVRGECVTYSMTNDQNIGGAGQLKTHHLQEITDSSQFAKVLNLSAAAAYSAAFVRAEAKAAFVKERKTNQFATTAIVAVTVVNSAKRATKVKLTAPMAALARTSPAEFRRKCGRFFVSSVATGGELDGYVSIETTTTKQKDALSALFDIKAKQFEAEGHLDNELTQELSKARAKVSVYEVGGNTEPVRTIDDLLRKYNEFAAVVEKGGARPVKMTLQAYETVENYPPRSQMSHEEIVLDKIVELALQYDSIAEDISYIVGHRDQFAMRPGTEAGLKATRDELNKQIAKAETAATTCRQKKECAVPALTSPDDLRERLPLRYRSVCDTRKLQIPMMAVQAQVGPTQGDGDMNGNNPKTTLKVTLEPAGNLPNLLNLHASVVMRESQKDWTTFTGDQSQVVYNLLSDEADAAGCVYDMSKTGPREATIEGNGGKNNWTATTIYGSGGLLVSAECLSDTKGIDTGKLGCRNLTFGDVQIALKHEEDVAPVARLQSLKANQVGRRRMIDNAIIMRRR